MWFRVQSEYLGELIGKIAPQSRLYLQLIPVMPDSLIDTESYCHPKIGGSVLTALRPHEASSSESDIVSMCR